MANRSMVSPGRAQGPQYEAVVKQGSVYNPSFDEVHSQLGNTDQKGLYRRNLDELVKNGQIVQNPTSSPSSASYFAGNLNLKGTMSKKSMEEVWNEYDMVEQEHVNRIDKQVQQPSLGADFLVRSAAMNVGKQEHIVSDAQPLLAIDPMVMVSHSQQADWLPLQMQMQMQMQVQIPGGCTSYPNLSVRRSVSEMCYSEKALPLGISLPMTCSSESQAGAGAMERKRQYSDEMLEKSIERRQKRMIKNRESAARSRARKQEHTKNMEDKKDSLEQTNGWLKKIKTLKRSVANREPEMHKRKTLILRRHAFPS